jgi:CRISPR-associated protein Csh1
MLDTLIRIGEWQESGKSELYRFLDFPNNKNKDQGNKIRNYCLPIIFDLDKMEIEISPVNLEAYDPKMTVPRLTVIGIRKGNQKAIYCSMPTQKIYHLYKTFFGKEKVDSSCGELVGIINKNHLDLKEGKLYKIARKIFPLKEQFYDLIFDPETDKLGYTKIKKSFNLPANEQIVLVYICVKSEEFGFTSPRAIGEMEEYQSFLKKELSSKQLTSKGLCYVSGKEVEATEKLYLKERYSLNKMFGTTLLNYANNFNKKNFSKNYQVATVNQKRLDLASSYLLKNYKTKIAGVNHVIIPQFLSSDQLDYELILEGLKKKSDGLFNFTEIKKLAVDARDEVAENTTEPIEHPFWISFFTFESDGTSFKTIEMIKDVSQFYFEKIIDTFGMVDEKWNSYSDFVNWKSVMAHGQKQYFFNLNSIYSLIPVRTEKKNVALNLFKMILEHRKIEQKQLYKYFSELILCHFYERYKSYSNVVQSKKDYFKKTVRESVFKYLAFFQVLRRLDMLDVENKKESPEVIGQVEMDEYRKKIQQFFQEMGLSQDQKAMFYLGRMLNYVEWLQKDKNRTIINSVQFDGMDLDKIIRLRNALMEKAKQYGKQRKLKFDDALFGEYFVYNHWLEEPLDPKEALFFILTGYSFGTKNNQVKKEPEPETEQVG